MSTKSKSPSRAAGASNADSDIESISDGGSVPNSQQRKRMGSEIFSSQVHPAVAAKLKEAKAAKAAKDAKVAKEAKGKQPAKKRKVDEPVNPSGLMVPLVTLDAPDSDDKFMDSPVLIGSDDGECGRIVLMFFIFIDEMMLFALSRAK